VVWWEVLGHWEQALEEDSSLIPVFFKSWSCGKQFCCVRTSAPWCAALPQAPKTREQLKPPKLCQINLFFIMSDICQWHKANTLPVSVAAKQFILIPPTLICYHKANFGLLAKDSFCYHKANFGLLAKDSFCYHKANFGLLAKDSFLIILTMKDPHLKISFLLNVNHLWLQSYLCYS
jgi:hypothetical protein